MSFKFKINDTTARKIVDQKKVVTSAKRNNLRYVNKKEDGSNLTTITTDLFQTTKNGVKFRLATPVSYDDVLTSYFAFPFINGTYHNLDVVFEYFANPVNNGDGTNCLPITSIINAMPFLYKDTYHASVPYSKARCGWKSQDEHYYMNTSMHDDRRLAFFSYYPSLFNTDLKMALNAEMTAADMRDPLRHLKAFIDANMIKNIPLLHTAKETFKTNYPFTSEVYDDLHKVYTVTSVQDLYDLFLYGIMKDFISHLMEDKPGSILEKECGLSLGAFTMAKASSQNRTHLRQVEVLTSQYAIMMTEFCNKYLTDIVSLPDVFSQIININVALDFGLAVNDLNDKYVKQFIDLAKKLKLPTEMLGALGVADVTMAWYNEPANMYVTDAADATMEILDLDKAEIKSFMKMNNLDILEQFISFVNTFFTQPKDLTNLVVMVNSDNTLELNCVREEAASAKTFTVDDLTFTRKNKVTKTLYPLATVGDDKKLYEPIIFTAQRRFFSSQMRSQPILSNFTDFYINSINKQYDWVLNQLQDAGTFDTAATEFDYNDILAHKNLEIRYLKDYGHFVIIDNGVTDVSSVKRTATCAWEIAEIRKIGGSVNDTEEKLLRSITTSDGKIAIPTDLVFYSDQTPSNSVIDHIDTSSASQTFAIDDHLAENTKIGTKIDLDASVKDKISVAASLVMLSSRAASLYAFNTLLAESTALKKSLTDAGIANQFSIKKEKLHKIFQDILPKFNLDAKTSTANLAMINELKKSSDDAIKGIGIVLENLTMKQYLYLLTHEVSLTKHSPTLRSTLTQSYLAHRNHIVESFDELLGTLISEKYRDYVATGKAKDAKFTPIDEKYFTLQTCHHYLAPAYENADENDRLELTFLNKKISIRKRAVNDLLENAREFKLLERANFMSTFWDVFSIDYSVFSKAADDAFNIRVKTGDDNKRHRLGNVLFNIANPEVKTDDEDNNDDDITKINGLEAVNKLRKKTDANSLTLLVHIADGLLNTVEYVTGCSLGYLGDVDLQEIIAMTAKRVSHG